MERPEQDAGPSTRAAIAAGSAVPGRRAGSLPGPASSLTASLPLDSGSKATAPAPARAPSFQPNLEPLRSTLTLEFSCALTQIIERDAEEANKQLAKQFRIHRCNEGTRPLLKVVQSGTKDRSVSFEPLEGAILIQGIDEKESYVDLQWDEEVLECNILLDRAKCELWQVSQKVLGPLFFS